jgi:hypothetical protein
MVDKPKPTSSLTERELIKAEEQFKAFDDNIQQMTMDRMNQAPKEDVEPLHRLAQKDIVDSKDIYLKPFRTIPSREKFNEKFREDYNFSKEYVKFIPEHKELQGEEITLWTKPYPGCGAEEWKIPTGKPVWAPRYVAERLHGSTYHRLVMQQNVSTGTDGLGTQYYGQMAVDTIVQRLDAIPVSNRKSIYMGAKGF